MNLTPDQCRIVRCLAEGDDYDMIARLLHTRTDIVERELHAARISLRAASDAHAVALFYERGMMPVQAYRNGVTPGQRLYLEFFEQWLRDPDPRWQHAKDAALVLMGAERSILGVNTDWTDDEDVASANGNGRVH